MSETQLFQISQNINLLRKANSPSQIQNLITLTNSLIKETTATLKQNLILAQSKPDDKKLKLSLNKLDKDLRDILARFKHESKNAAERQRAHITSSNPSSSNNAASNHDDETKPLLATSQDYSSSSVSPSKVLESLQLTQLDNQIDFNEALIQERDQDLHQIEQSITQVNEIFRDLGTLVHDQGHMLGLSFYLTP